MRGAFGLVGILVVMAIILYALAGRMGCGGRSYLQTVTGVKKEKEPLVNQWGGRDPRGRPFSESLTLAEWPDAGTLKGLKVTSIDPAGVAATHFGLQQDDVILEIGPHAVGGAIVDSAESGNDFLQETFRLSGRIKIRRGEQPLILPDQKTTPAGTSGAAGAAPNIPGLPGGQPQGR